MSRILFPLSRQVLVGVASVGLGIGVVFAWWWSSRKQSKLRVYSVTSDSTIRVGVYSRNGDYRKIDDFVVQGLGEGPSDGHHVKAAPRFYHKSDPSCQEEFIQNAEGSDPAHQQWRVYTREGIHKIDIIVQRLH